MKQKKPERPLKEIEVDEETVSWKNIKPNRTYEDIKRQFYKNERKRKYQEIREAKAEHDASKIGIGMHSPAKKRY